MAGQTTVCESAAGQMEGARLLFFIFFSTNIFGSCSCCIVVIVRSVCPVERRLHLTSSQYWLKSPAGAHLCGRAFLAACYCSRFKQLGICRSRTFMRFSFSQIFLARLLDLAVLSFKKDRWLGFCRVKKGAQRRASRGSSVRACALKYIVKAPMTPLTLKLISGLIFSLA